MMPVMVVLSKHYRNLFLQGQQELFCLSGVTMVPLTTNPISRLSHSLASIMHENCGVILLVLPCSTFMELAGMQMA